MTIQEFIFNGMGIVTWVPHVERNQVFLGIAFIAIVIAVSIFTLYRSATSKGWRSAAIKALPLMALMGYTVYLSLPVLFMDNARRLENSTDLSRAFHDGILIRDMDPRGRDITFSLLRSDGPPSPYTMSIDDFCVMMIMAVREGKDTSRDISWLYPYQSVMLHEALQKAKDDQRLTWHPSVAVSKPWIL